MKPNDKHGSQPAGLRPVNEVIHQVRCSHTDLTHRRTGMCEARFFDSRVIWRMVPVADALLIVRCWRCGKIVPLAPVFTDSDLKRVADTSPATRAVREDNGVLPAGSSKGDPDGRAD